MDRNLRHESRRRFAGMDECRFQRPKHPVQINAQVPSGIPIGQQQIGVTAATGTSAPYAITVILTEPGLPAPASLAVGGTQYVTAIFSASLTPVLTPGDITGFASQRAQPGDSIILYGIGFDPVIPDSPASQIVQQANALATSLQFSFGVAHCDFRRSMATSCHTRVRPPVSRNGHTTLKYRITHSVSMT
jgi:hypothetical protein